MTTIPAPPLPPHEAAVAAREKKRAVRYAIHLVGMSLISFAVGFLMSYDAATMRNAGNGNGNGNHNSIIEIIDGASSSSHERMDESSGGGSSSTRRDDVNAAMLPTPGGPNNRRASVVSSSPPPTTLELLGRIMIHQRRMRETMSIPEYGRFACPIFCVENLEGGLFRASPLSRKRLVRRLMIKILMGRIHHGGKKKGGEEEEEEVPIFRWVTVGDSAAAGHGNAPSDVYTSVLEDTVGELFGIAGVRFVADNVAGDSRSGMELALCMESIAGHEGDDVDALAWDFAATMTANSGRNAAGDGFFGGQGVDPLLFGERAGRVLPRLPFLFYLNMPSDGAGSPERMQRLETGGMGMDVLGGEALRELVRTFPNYNNVAKGRNGAQAVNGLRCGVLVEGEGTDCAAIKYRGPPSCRDGEDARLNPLNDGWKVHRLKGRLLGFHLAEMLRLAVVELDILERQRPRMRADPSMALDALRAEEEVEEFLFAKTRPSGSDNGGGGGDAAGADLGSWGFLGQSDAFCVAAGVADASTMARQTEGEPAGNYLRPPPGTPCDANPVYSRNPSLLLGREDGWASFDTLAHSPRGRHRAAAGGAPPIALGLCLDRRGAADDTMFPINRDEVDIGIGVEGDEINTASSGWKRAGGCHVVPVPASAGMPDGGSVAVIDDGHVPPLRDGVVRVRNRGEEALLVSSAFMLY